MIPNKQWKYEKADKRIVITRTDDGLKIMVDGLIPGCLGAYHQILIEVDRTVRDPVIDGLFEFLREIKEEHVVA